MIHRQNNHQLSKKYCEEHIYSDDMSKKQEYISRNTIEADTRPITGLDRYILRHNKYAKMILDVK